MSAQAVADPSLTWEPEQQPRRRRRAAAQAAAQTPAPPASVEELPDDDDESSTFESDHRQKNTSRPLQDEPNDQQPGSQTTAKLGFFARWFAPPWGRRPLASASAAVAEAVIEELDTELASAASLESPLLPKQKVGMFGSVKRVLTARLQSYDRPNITNYWRYSVGILQHILVSLPFLPRWISPKTLSDLAPGLLLAAVTLSMYKYGLQMIALVVAVCLPLERVFQAIKTENTAELIRWNHYWIWVGVGMSLLDALLLLYFSQIWIIPLIQMSICWSLVHTEVLTSARYNKLYFWIMTQVEAIADAAAIIVKQGLPTDVSTPTAAVVGSPIPVPEASGAKKQRNKQHKQHNSEEQPVVNLSLPKQPPLPVVSPPAPLAAVAQPQADPQNPVSDHTASPAPTAFSALATPPMFGLPPMRKPLDPALFMHQLPSFLQDNVTGSVGGGEEVKQREATLSAIAAQRAASLQALRNMANMAGMAGIAMDLPRGGGGAGGAANPAARFGVFGSAGQRSFQGPPGFAGDRYSQQLRQQQHSAVFGRAQNAAAPFIMPQMTGWPQPQQPQSQQQQAPSTPLPPTTSSFATLSTSASLATSSVTAGGPDTNPASEPAGEPASNPVPAEVTANVNVALIPPNIVLSSIDDVN